MKLSIFTRSTTLVFLVSCLVVATTTKASPLLGVHLDTGELYSISTGDASVTLIGNTGVSNMGSLEFAPDGTLYGYTTGVNSILYSIDPATAVATQVGPLNLNYYIYEGALAIAPDGTAYGTNGINQTSPMLFGIDLGTGQASPIGLMSGGERDVGGLVWREPRVQGGNPPVGGTLIGLDRITPASLLTIDPNNANASPIVPLNVGVEPGINGGMALLNASDPARQAVGYFTTAAGTGDNSLYSFNPYTGAHSRVGVFDPLVITGSGFSGLAAIPEPTSLVLLATGAFAFLRRRRQ